jgi:hypothetical protein
MGSFKQLKSSDVITVPVIANRTWNFNYCPIPSTDPYISVYNGTNYTNSFDPGNEPITNTQYDRLTYRQINQLFYHRYSGSLNTASLASSIHYLSASSQHPSASFFNYNNDPAFISNFPTGANETIRVIQISPDAYGNRVLPYSFQMSSSQYNFYDDGKGNIFDNFSGPTPIFVGNIFYPEGTVVITSQAYQNAFVLPAVAYDDAYTIVRNDYPNPATFSFYPLLNDDLRGNTLVNNSIQIFGGNASFFSTGSNNSVSLSFSGLGVGVYQTFYTFLTTGSYCAALMSSTASITVNVTDPDCEFEIGIIIPPPFPPGLSPSPTATPSVTATPSITVTPSLTPSRTVTPTVTPSITATPTVTPTPSPSSPYEFREAGGCCLGDKQVISIPSTFGAGYYVTNTGQCYNVVGVPTSGPATIIWDGGTLYPSCATCTSVNLCPSPSPTPTKSATPSVTPSITVSPSLTPTVTPSITVSPSLTPSRTPSITVSATPSVTPSITVSRTPSVTPSSSPPALQILQLQYGGTAEIACSGVTETYFCLDNVNLCLATTVYDSDGAACLGTQPTALYISDGSGNVRFWNGIAFTTSCTACVPASPSPTPTKSATPTVTPSITVSATPSVTPSITVSRTPTATPSISISATPSVTPSISISRTPTVTPSISVSLTPTVTPSSSPPLTGDIVILNFGANKGTACSEFSSTDYYCLVDSSGICGATALLSSDGVSCFGYAPAQSVSEGGGPGANVRSWNGTSWTGTCSTCI